MKPIIIKDRIKKYGTVKWEEVKPLQSSDFKKYRPEQMEKLKTSIVKNGFATPLFIWEDEKGEKILLDGFHRIIAYREMKEIDGVNIPPEVPALFVNCKDRKEAKKTLLILNSHYAEIQKAALWEFVSDLDLDEMVTEIDIPGMEWEDLQSDEIIEDEVPALPKKPRTKPGDIYTLGNHRLMCGDANKKEHIEKLLDGQQVNLLITDPPYNVDYQGTAGKIQNDNMGDAAFKKFLTDSFSAANSVMHKGAAFYIFHADSEGYNFRSAAIATGWKIRQCLIWVKNSLVMGRQDYQWQHEPILYGWKDGSAHYFTDDRSHTTVIEDKPDINKMNKEQLKGLLQEILNAGKVQHSSVIHCNKPAKNDIHPTMKPIKLVARIMGNSSRIGDIVLDIFGGSGSTLIAAAQTERRAYTMEIDPKFCDVIVQRWVNLTGGKVFIEGKRIEWSADELQERG